MQGIDTARPLGALTAALVARGIGFAARYYSFNPGKNLHATEAAALTQAGVHIVCVWEAAGDHYEWFTATQGMKDADAALELAVQCGQPDGSAIYFAVDFDASPAEIAAGIKDYFAAVKSALMGKYEVGAYGSGLVCSTLRDLGLARYLWLAQSSGWRGSKAFGGAHIYQNAPTMIAGIAVDTDVSGDSDFGAWAPVTPAVTQTVAIPSARDLQAALAAEGRYVGAVDGVWGPHSQQALAAHYANAAA